MLRQEMKTINVTDEELRRLRCIGSGGFGTVFADNANECTIKKYHDFIKSDCHVSIPNPCLRMKKKKFKRLNKRDNMIKYTDVFVELVYQGFKFVGVKKKLYCGETLDKLGSMPLTIKKDMMSKLIRNAQELTKNKIYTLDFKANNVILTTHGEIKIIDLDDVLTKVTLLPNFYYKKKSLKKLKDTIIYYFYNNQFYFSSEVARKITSGPENNQDLQKKMSYNELQELVNSIKMERNIIILEYQDISKIDLSLLKSYMTDNELFLVLAFNGNALFRNEKAISLIETLNDAGIDVYDIFKYDDDCYESDIESYINAHESTNVHIYDDKFKVLKRK